MCLQIFGPQMSKEPHQPCPGPAPSPWSWSTNPGTRVLQAQQIRAGQERFHTCIHSRRVPELHGHHCCHSGDQLMAWEWWPHVTLDARKLLEKTDVPLVAPTTSLGIPWGSLLCLGSGRQGCCYEPIWNHCLLHPTKYSEWIIHYNVTEFFHNHRTWHPGF